MEVLEFLFGVLELIEALCEIVPWLVRAPFRLVRWIMAPSGERPALPEESRMRSEADSRTIIHTSLTRRPRGKRRGMSYEAG